VLDDKPIAYAECLCYVTGGMGYLSF